MKRGETFYSRHTSTTSAVVKLANAQEEEEVWCECSDDEMYNPCKLKKGTWEPKAEDMIKLFDELTSNKVLDLSWQCPGRRPPESDNEKEEEIKQEPISTPPKQEEKKQMTPSKFDFDDDLNEPKSVMTPRWTPGSTPRPQKKVARMDKVLKEMMQQRKQQAAEREARKLAKSPRAPGSPSRARLGSPGSSPRTPPVSQPNRQSPVRSVAPNDSVMTTPVRAPVDSETSQTKMTVGDIFAGQTQTPTSSHSVQGQYTPVRQTPSTTPSSRPSSGDKPLTPKTSSPAASSSSVTLVSSGKPSDSSAQKPVITSSNEVVKESPSTDSMDTS